MKKHILLASITTAVLITTGCSNTNYSNETINNKSKILNESTVAKQKNSIKNAVIEETEKLKASYQDKNNIKKPDIEETRDFNASLKNGSVIMISRDNSNELEVYNIASLDRFVEAFNNGKEDYVRVIKGIILNGKLLVNKLDEYETDGKIVKITTYDTYTDKNKFIPGTPSYAPKIVKTSTNNGIRYAILESKDTPDNMGATVISFDKSSIKN